MKTYLAARNEALKSAFGFKGGSVQALRQVACAIADGDREGYGLGVQSVLWSDEKVFSELGNDAGNELMLGITRAALAYIRDTGDTDFDRILLFAREYARKSRPDLRETFILNALTPVDFALWQLRGEAPALPALNPRKIGRIPLLPYGASADEARRVAEAGAFLIKIKLGRDVESDIARMRQLHGALHAFQTPCTQTGRVAYYLDLNGRYESRAQLETLLRALPLEDVLLLEEPFPEEAEIDVRDLPVRIAADESAHDPVCAARRLDLGYSAVALKPIAKGLTNSLRILALAQSRGVPCFCADLTVNPAMAAINLWFGACLPPLPGLLLPAVESNGAENYSDWSSMPGARLFPSDRLFIEPDDAFYQSRGGLLERPDPWYLRGIKEV